MSIKVFIIRFNRVLWSMVQNLIIFHVILVLDKVKTCLHCYFLYLLMIWNIFTSIFSNDAQGLQKGLDCLFVL